MAMNDPLARLMNLRQQAAAPAEASLPGLSGCVIRPLGLVGGEDARRAVDAGLAYWLAGGPLAFTAVMVSDGTPGGADVETRTVRDFARLRDSRLSARLEALTAPRAPLGGLSWARTRIAGVVDLSAETTADPKFAVSRGRMMAREGADAVAVTMSDAAGARGGAESERDLVCEVVSGLSGEGIRVAVLTRSAEVMRDAAKAGARLLGDTGGLEDDEIVNVAADCGLPVLVRPMHQDRPGAPDEAVVAIHQRLEAVLDMFAGAGVPRGRLMVDPGIGALGEVQADLALLGGLAAFHGLGCPVAVGPDRAALVGAITGEPDPQRRGPGENVLTLAAMAQGVQLVLTRKVAEVWQLAVAQRAAQTGRLGDLR